MAKINVSIPQGTRDFGADTVRKRNYIFQTIRKVFELHGFQPLETPAMENIDTLMGKYGEEGDKLIFKILNNGLNDPRNAEKAKSAFDLMMAGKNHRDLTERALRYDLTIPFARYVVMNHGQLTMPFKRYQLQPVWRADRPQKGRYREFYQCDADIVGSNSLLNEVELATIYSTAFDRLRLPVEIKINSRKILSALAESCGGQEYLVAITTAIDKLDKIGIDKVKEELSHRGLNTEQVDKITKYLAISGSNEEKLADVKSLLGDLPAAQAGLIELEYLLQFPHQIPADRLQVDLTLARGLNYYTGLIFEIKATTVSIGSIGGGGRYDDLTGTFGLPNIPGVGISFGVDRIYDALDELKLFPDSLQVSTEMLFFNLGEAESRQAFPLMESLRMQGISVELYPDPVKFDKQFKYAEKKSIPWIVIIGSEELATQTCKVKNLASGEQDTVPQSNFAEWFHAKTQR